MVTKSAPGKHYRQGITLIEAVKRFDTEEKAEAWFISKRWPDGVSCPFCDGFNVSNVANRKPQPFHCRDCRKYFSVKTGTLMHSSKIPLSQWAIAFYLFATNLKSVSSMKLHRDLGIRQASAWYMAHRIRGMWSKEADRFAGSVEADETYIGGLEKNKHQSKHLRAGRGAVGKTPVAGIRDRATGRIKTEVVERTDKATLQGFVLRHTAEGTTVYTDEHGSYLGLPRHHETVSHSVGEYVRGMASTNGMESHWAMFKRSIVGTFHHVSPKHLPLYVLESEGRHNARPLDTEEQMAMIACGAAGKRMRYVDLVG